METAVEFNCVCCNDLQLNGVFALFKTPKHPALNVLSAAYMVINIKHARLTFHT